MRQNKLKVYKILSLIAGGICLVCVVWLLIALALAGWKFFAVKPVWLGFMLLLFAGISLMAVCVFSYLIICIKNEITSTVFCEKCGAECDVNAAFCAACGANLSKKE